MKSVFVLTLAVLVLLMAAPVMAIACAGCDFTLEPLAAFADRIAAVHIAPGASESIAAGAAQREGADKPFYIDMTIFAGGTATVDNGDGQGWHINNYMIEDAGATATAYRRARDAL